MQEARPETAARKLFAANLWRERKARGLSQRALAQLAGLDRTYVGSVERGWLVLHESVFASHDLLTVRLRTRVTPRRPIRCAFVLTFNKALTEPEPIF